MIFNKQKCQHEFHLTGKADGHSHSQPRRLSVARGAETSAPLRLQRLTSAAFQALYALRKIHPSCRALWDPSCYCSGKGPTSIIITW